MKMLQLKAKTELLSWIYLFYLKQSPSVCKFIFHGNKIIPYNLLKTLLVIYVLGINHSLPRLL